MNTVTEAWIDAKSKMGNLKINGHAVPVFFVTGTLNKKTLCYGKPWVAVYVAYDWNMSNRIEIKAATLKTLIKKIEKAEYRLVRYTA